MLTDNTQRRHFHRSMFHGHDFDSTMLRIGSMNMLMHGIESPDIEYRDSLSEGASAEAGAYFLILANPPAGSLDYEWTSKDLLRVVKTKKTELLFLALFLRLLRPGGRAAVIPDGVLFGSSKAHRDLRRTLIEEQKLDAVVKLPSGVFRPYAGGGDGDPVRHPDRSVQRELLGRRISRRLPRQRERGGTAAADPVGSGSLPEPGAVGAVVLEPGGRRRTTGARAVSDHRGRPDVAGRTPGRHHRAGPAEPSRLRLPARSRGRVKRFRGSVELDRAASAEALEDTGLSPTEQVEQGIQRIHADVATELLTRLHAQEPAFFEQAVLDLLMAMGYGGAEGQATRTQLSNDGGINGIIDQDALGLSRVYVQAKRYAPDATVGRPEVQGFVGALHGNQASQGVFIATGRFSGSAQQFADTVATRVVLIDGARLTRLMIRYRVGVQVQQTYEIVEIDEDFFE